MYKNWIKNALTSTIILIVLVVSINFVTDPYQHYRKTTIYPAFFGGNQRYLNPGLAKHYKYNSVIIGTSMTEKFYVPQVNKTFNSSFLKLSISGSTAYEQNLILNQAIETKQVKKVLWGLDLYSLKGEVEQYRNGKNSFPLYLYDNNILNDYKYLLNKDTLFEFIKIFKKYYIQKNKFYFDINNLFFSKDKHENILKSDIISLFNKKLVNSHFIKKDFIFKTMRQNFDENVYKIIKENPEIEFDIFLPPYSILAWYDINEQGWINDALQTKLYIYQKLNSLKNAHLYDFQANMDFITNLDNYVDTTHYKSKYNSHILNTIYKKEISLDIHKNNDKIKTYIDKLKNGMLKEFLK